MTHEILLKFKEIRNHGVNCFKNSVSMKNIELVLPQLVQALRYEEFEQTHSRVQTGLKEFLIEKAIESKVIFNNLYWHLKLEKESQENDEIV